MIVAEQSDGLDKHANYAALDSVPGCSGTGYELGEFLTDLKERVSTQELQSMGAAACRITYEDLDIAMGLHWKSIGAQNYDDKKLFTVPGSRMIEWFQNLKAQGLSKRSCNSQKVRVLRRALCSIGYITEVDPRWSPARAKRWGIGANCPRYQQYVKSGKATLETKLRAEVKLQLKEVSMKLP